MTLSLFRQPISFVQQEQSNWCWAACMAMVLGPEPSQCSMANNAFDHSDGRCCFDGTTADCDLPLMVRRISEEWFRYDVEAVFTNGSLSEQGAAACLSNGNPIEIGIVWNGGGGHAVLLVGHTQTEGGRRFTVYDPLEGIFVGSFSDILNAFGSGKWTWSWEIMRPKEEKSDGLV